MKSWKKELFTIPNMLSLLRLILIPIYMAIYQKARTPDDYLLAASVLTLSCITDMIDGMVARRFNMVSTLGKILDPIADKATQFALFFSLSLKYIPLRPVLILFIIKEAFQMIAGIFMLLAGKMLTGALPAGKLCTAVLFISLILMVLFPEMTDRAVYFLSAVDSVFLLYSFLSYFLVYYGHTSALHDIRRN